MGGKPTTRKAKSGWRIETITDQDPKKKAAVKKDQRKDKGDNGYAWTVQEDWEGASEREQATKLSRDMDKMVFEPTEFIKEDEY